LFLNSLYEIWYIKHYCPGSEISLSSWNIILPMISFTISLIVVLIRE